MSAGFAFAIAAGLTVSWLAWKLHARIWPWTRCRWCRGTGRKFGSRSGFWGDCWFCKGSGKKLRRGARKEAS